MVKETERRGGVGGTVGVGAGNETPGEEIHSLFPLISAFSSRASVPTVWIEDKSELGNILKKTCIQERNILSFEKEMFPLQQFSVF